MKRTVTFLTALLMAPLSAIHAADAQPTAGKPNILFICIDDLRPVPGCYGGAAKTPNIDRLARESVLFQRHYVQFPSCGPSRSSMLSGQRPDSLGIYGNSGTDAAYSDPQKPTLPMLFKQHDYTTLSFGKVYHSKGAAPGCGWSEAPWHPPSWDCYVNFGEKQRKKQNLGDWRPAMEIYDGPDALHGDYQTADQVIAALEKHKEGPFFIAAGFYKPHLPFVAPKRFWDLYRDDEIQLVEPVQRAAGAAAYGYAFNEIASYSRADKSLFSDESPPNKQEALDLIHAYYAAVSFTDSHVGRILAKLDELGLHDSTAIVLWGDHGFHLGDQARWAKWTQFEVDMRSPLMIRLPGKTTPSRQIDALVESVDIYPTLAAIAGLPAPGHLEGMSLLPLMEGRVGEVKSYARSQVAGQQSSKHLMAYSVRTAQHRYSEWRDRTQENKIVHRELYDLGTTTYELKNIIDDPAQQTIIEQHHQLIESGYASLQARPTTAAPRPKGNPTRRERRALREQAAAEATKTTTDANEASPSKASAKIKSSKPTQPPLTPVDIDQLPDGTDHLDLYLLIGQSNMKGRGFMPEEPAHDPRIAMMHLKNDSWYVARHPLHLTGDPQTFAGADNAGAGPGLSFAQTLAAKDPSARIGLIPCAVGGSEIERWQKGAGLYEDAIRRVRLALQTTSAVKGQLRGVLWLQGEADSKAEHVKTYAEKLHGLVDALRTDLAQPALPFVACTIGEMHTGGRSGENHPINSLLLDLPNHRPHTACVDARDLKTSIGDNVHYDTAAQTEIGKRFALLLQKPGP